MRLPGRLTGRGVVALSAALLILPVALLLATGVAAAQRDEGEGDLYPAACYLLSPTTGAVSEGHDHVKLGTVDGCNLSSCWKPYEEPEGGRHCAYGRGAELDLGIKGSAKGAKEFVAQEIARAQMKKLRRGFPGLAGVFSNAKEGIVEMAVGKNIARLSLGAESDNNPSPTWPRVRKEVIEDAQLIALQLREEGCPESLAKCH